MATNMATERPRRFCVTNALPGELPRRLHYVEAFLSEVRPKAYTMLSNMGKGLTAPSAELAVQAADFESIGVGETLEVSAEHVRSIGTGAGSVLEVRVYVTRLY